MQHVHTSTVLNAYTMFTFNSLIKPLNSYRLGGIPLGVIAVETRTVELTIPADPANLDSESKVSKFHRLTSDLSAFFVEIFLPLRLFDCVCSVQVLQQAGQVWFPDSAFKTGQVICDFNRERLPLMVFANWRGFSGGMKGKW